MKFPPFWTTASIYFSDGTPYMHEVLVHEGPSGVQIKLPEDGLPTGADNRELIPWHRIQKVTWRSEAEVD